MSGVIQKLGREEKEKLIFQPLQRIIRLLGLSLEQIDIHEPTSHWRCSWNFSEGLIPLTNCRREEEL